LNIVDREGPRSEIDCSAANKSREGSLGHAVDARAGEGRANSGIAANQNDPASIFHFLGGCLNTDKGSTNVDGHHAVEVFETVRIDCAPGKNASAADEDVQRAKDFACSSDGGRNSLAEALSAFRASALPPADSISRTSWRAFSSELE
jgi:hypothetical protein